MEYVDKFLKIFLYLNIYIYLPIDAISNTFSSAAG